MKKLFIAVCIFAFGCTSPQVDTTGDYPEVTLGFVDYTIEFVGDSKMYIHKIGGRDIFFDKAYFSVDGKTFEFSTTARMGYHSEYAIDRKFIKSLSNAGLVSWRPSDYANVVHDFSGEHFRRMREYGEYFK